MGGMAEEYLELGIQLERTGHFHPFPGDPHPFVFRPPGYAAFVAGVLLATGGSGDAPVSVARGQILRRVLVAQAGLLGLSAVALFLFLARRLTVGPAWCLGLAFGLQPYALLLVGFAHYEVLHLALSGLGTLALAAGLGRLEQRPSFAHLCLGGAGVIWGLSTLVRPTTLILPPFVWLATWLTLPSGSARRGRRALATTVVFSAGLLLVVAPYTARNYAHTGAFIPVNAQGKVMIWASSVREVPRDPNHYWWWLIWYQDGVPVVERVTGVGRYDYPTFVANVLAIEREFGRELASNLWRQPEIYLRNVARNVATFTLDWNTVQVQGFQALQEQEGPFDREWLIPGHAQDFHSALAARVTGWWLGALTLLAWLGAVQAIEARARWWLVPGAVYACFCAAHAITHMELFYYYVKLPLVFTFVGFLAVRGERVELGVVGGRPLTACHALCGGVLAATLAQVALVAAG